MKPFLIVLAVLTLGSHGFASEKNSGDVKVYRFENLDVEGKVKSPQLMYFLKRVRTRFQSFRLPKQNFNQKTMETKDADFLR